MEHTHKRTRPNILITGTPGTGKSATASLIAERCNMKLISVGDLVKEYSCHEGMCDEFDSYILDEDKLLDVMEPLMSTFSSENSDFGDSDSDNDDVDDLCNGKNGIVVDYHSCEFFPERWFDLILVLRVSTENLYDRLVKRGYSEKKRNENMECEIMQVVLQEARDSYANEIVHEVPSNTIEDMESNVTRIQQWATQWKENNKKS